LRSSPEKIERPPVTRHAERSDQLRKERRCGLRPDAVKPHRLERYVANDDPKFEEKAADIIALYICPPQHAAVFCVDEKTAIQALDRLDPVLPPSPGRAEVWIRNTTTVEYSRFTQHWM
jgi:hypothetical protein